jgi:hypothetical protein
MGEGEKLARALENVSDNPRNYKDWLQAHADNRFRRMAIGALFTRFDLISNELLARIAPKDNRVLGPIMQRYSNAGVVKRVGSFSDKRRSHCGDIAQWMKIAQL